MNQLASDELGLIKNLGFDVAPFDFIDRSQDSTDYQNLA